MPAQGHVEPAFVRHPSVVREQEPHRVVEQVQRAVCARDVGDPLIEGLHHGAVRLARGGLDVGAAVVVERWRLDWSVHGLVREVQEGGRRLVQDATGYIATIKNGVVVSENGKANGLLPGKLIRGKQVCEVKSGISEVSLFDKTIRLLAVKALRFFWRLSGKSMKTTIVSET